MAEVTKIHIAIGCTQRFDVTVTGPLIDLLTRLGNTHYDGVCKAAVARGGFIYGWGNRMDWTKESGTAGDSFVDPITNGQLQTCLKICENRLPSMTEEALALRREFSMLGFAALRQAGEDPRFATTVPVVGRSP